MILDVSSELYEKYTDEGPILTETFDYCINSPDFCVKFEQILNKCSFDLMVLTLEHLHKEISSTQEQIKNIESQLCSAVPVEEFNALKKKIETNINQHRRDIELKKRSKFQRDLEDYELNRVYQWQDKSTTKKPFRQDGYRSSVDYTTSDSDPEKSGRYQHQGRFLGRQRRREKRRGPDGDSTGPRNMDFTRITRSQINQVTPSITQFPSAGITAASLGLRDKSTYQPPKGSHPLETFIHFVDKSFKNLRKDVDRGLIHYPSNLSVTERQALKSLQQEKDIIIKSADKGGAIVIMDKLHYRNEVYRQLGDSTTYRKLSHNPTTAIQDTVKTTLDGFQTRGILDDKTHAFLTKKHPITPVFYILPKIHKDLHNPPGRPIVASTDSVLAPISIYLEKILTPMIRNTRSFLLDTGAFLQIIEDITPVPSDAILVSFDVKDLYTSIPHTDGIHSTRWLLSNNNTNSGLIDLCCTLLSIVLNNNFFLFEDSYYLQTKGSAMGSNVAPPYANAYMAHYEDTLIYTNSLFRQHVLTWKRYIDDIFCIWKGDLDSLQIFFQFLKNAWPGLDFTMSHDPHQISFLDTLVNKDTDGNLSTDLYSKPTDRNSLLHYDSFHPPNMKKSIPKSQLNRVTKIVSDPVIKDQRISEMKSKFRERGYPLRILDNATTDHNIIKRPPASSRIPFIHQYHPAAYILHKTIRQHWHILQMAYPSVLATLTRQKPSLDPSRDLYRKEYSQERVKTSVQTDISQTLRRDDSPSIFEERDEHSSCELVETTVVDAWAKRPIFLLDEEEPSSSWGGGLLDKPSSQILLDVIGHGLSLSRRKRVDPTSRRSRSRDKIDGAICSDLKLHLFGDTDNGIFQGSTIYGDDAPGPLQWNNWNPELPGHSLLDEISTRSRVQIGRLGEPHLPEDYLYGYG
ncbi:unnamed protein product [Ranitomeya imitator]|uniref:Reverse transcriptase domain-containing protein n=1 Tax=Ranitomeya imitator TaxID=111125 RepID=A0ABN9KQE4_9NEOB|nr:unnamed protein product [Ranitomeya imitator]